MIVTPVTTPPVTVATPIACDVVIPLGAAIVTVGMKSYPEPPEVTSIDETVPAVETIAVPVQSSVDDVRYYYRHRQCT